MASVSTEASAVPLSANRALAPQGDDEGDRLVVLEYQRWHRGAGGQPVPAVDTGRRVDRVAETAEPVDVAPQGAR